MKEGINFEDINSRFSINFLASYKPKLDKLLNEGLLIYDASKVSLTLWRYSFELSNYAFLTLLS